MTIHKYTFVTDAARHEVFLPKGAIILSVANQYDHVAMWYGHENGITEKRKFLLVPTGGSGDGKFLGTVLMYNGTFVLHVFEEVAWT